MRIILSNESEIKVLPVIPPGLQIPSDVRQNSEVTLLNIGTVTIPGEKRTKVFDISSFFPNKYYDFIDPQSNYDGWSYIEFIENSIENNFFINVVVTQNNKEILNMRTIVTDFSYNLDKAGDIIYNLKLKEYRRII